MRTHACTCTHMHTKIQTHIRTHAACSVVPESRRPRFNAADLASAPGTAQHFQGVLAPCAQKRGTAYSRCASTVCSKTRHSVFKVCKHRVLRNEAQHLQGVQAPCAQKRDTASSRFASTVCSKTRRCAQKRDTAFCLGPCAASALCSLCRPLCRLLCSICLG